MTVPLAILAFFAIALGVIGTPAWPWFRAFLEGRAANFELARLCRTGLAPADGHFDRSSSFSASVSAGGSTATSRRSRKSLTCSRKPCPGSGPPLRDRLYVDEFYGVTVIAFYYVVGARGRLARSPRVGRHRRGRCMALRPLGAAQSPARHQLGRRQLRQSLRRTLDRRRPAGARRERPRADLPAHSRRRPSSRSPQFSSGAAGHERNRDRLSAF